MYAMRIILMHHQNQSKMHNFEDYMKKEILNLVSDEKWQARSTRVSRASSITRDTPYVVSLKRSDNTYWKTHSRERLIIPSNPKEQTTGKTYTLRQTINRSKSAFYRNLLKAQKTLNQKVSTQRNTIKPSKRKDTQATNSTHRRQVLDSHMQLKKIQDMGTLQLMKRQFSTASDNYLRAKLEHSKHRLPSNLEGLAIIKI